MGLYSRKLLGSSRGHNTDSLVSLTFRSVLLLVFFCCTIPGLSSVHVLTPTCNQWVIWESCMAICNSFTTWAQCTVSTYLCIYNYVSFFSFHQCITVFGRDQFYFCYGKNTPLVCTDFPGILIFTPTAVHRLIFGVHLSAWLLYSYFILDYVMSCSKYFISSYSHGLCYILL